MRGPGFQCMTTQCLTGAVQLAPVKVYRTGYITDITPVPNSTVNNFITPILHSKVMQNWLYHRWKKMWYTMQRYGLPKNMEEALELVRASPTQTEGFALLADATDVR